MSNDQSYRALAKSNVSAAIKSLEAAANADGYTEHGAKAQDASALLLLAMYHELCHGHDQQAAQNEAIKKLTHDLGELAAELGMLRSSILGNQ